jgi:hypothetical protein
MDHTVEVEDESDDGAERENRNQGGGRVFGNLELYQRLHVLPK